MSTDPLTDEVRPMFLSLAEAGHEFGVKASRMQQLVAAGLVPSIRLGRRILIPRAALAAMAATAVEQARELARTN